MAPNPRGHAAFLIALLLVSLISSVIALKPMPQQYETPFKGTEARVAFATTPPLIVYCEVADSAEERERGLMYRHHLDKDKGMLFVFDEPKTATFWMKNTYIPLDIIFIGPDLRVLNVAEAGVEIGVSDNDLTLYRSDGPALYVVEVNQGLSREYGINPGIEVDIQI